MVSSDRDMFDGSNHDAEGRTTAEHEDNSSLNGSMSLNLLAESSPTASAGANVNTVSDYPHNDDGQRIEEPPDNQVDDDVEPCPVEELFSEGDSLPPEQSRFREDMPEDQEELSDHDSHTMSSPPDSLELWANNV